MGVSVLAVLNKEMKLFYISGCGDSRTKKLHFGTTLLLASIERICSDGQPSPQKRKP